MKSVLAMLTLATVLLVQPAKAMIRPAGSFVPSLCGVQIQEASQQAQIAVLLGQVCIGEVTGERGETGSPAVAFRLNDGSQHVYLITKTANLMIAMMSGETNSMFYLQSENGHRTTMKVIRSVDGSILSASGTLGEIRYVAKDFQPIFVIQRTGDGF